MGDGAAGRARLSASDLLMTGAWLAPIVAALCLAFSSGGYFITAWGTAAIVLLGLLASIILVHDVEWGGRWGVAALCGWAGLALWQGVSSLWAFQPSAAITTMNRTLLYAAAFALVLVGLRRASDLTWLLYAALVGSALVAAYALASRLVPSLVTEDSPARLSPPISYWNGLGALLAFGALLAVGVAGHPDRTRWVRAGGAALVPMFLTALLLTYSRGAVIALVIGVALLLAVAPARLETVLALATSVGVSIPFLLAVNGEERIAAVSGTLPPSDGVGERLALVLAFVMAASAALGWGGAVLMERLTHRARRPVGFAVGASVIVVCIAAALVSMPDDGPLGWTERQLDSFQTFDAQARNDARSVSDRLAVAAGSGRWQNWTVAADEFRSSPIAGSGAGDYRFFWEADRDIDLTVQNAHSLYLEVLGETGLIGLVLLLIPMAAVLIAVGPVLFTGPPTRARRDIGIAVAAGAVVGVHMAIDWDWQLPAIALPAVALGAAALKAAFLSRPPAAVRSGTGSRWVVGSRWIVGIGAVTAILVVVGPIASAAAVKDAQRAAAGGDLVAALAGARRAASLNPNAPEPWLLQANILSDLGRGVQADRAFAQALARSPRDWVALSDWASSLRDRGQLTDARALALRAQRANPREKRIDYLLQSLAQS